MSHEGRPGGDHTSPPPRPWPPRRTARGWRSSRRRASRCCCSPIRVDGGCSRTCKFEGKSLQRASPRAHDLGPATGRGREEAGPRAAAESFADARPPEGRAGQPRQDVRVTTAWSTRQPAWVGEGDMSGTWRACSKQAGQTRRNSQPVLEVPTPSMRAGEEARRAARRCGAVRRPGAGAVHDNALLAGRRSANDPAAHVKRPGADPGPSVNRPRSPERRRYRRLVSI